MLYEYDRFNRLIKLTDPLGLFETYTYDKVGNLLSKRDKIGNTISNVYDKMNNLTDVSTKHVKGTAGTEFIKNVYSITGALVSTENENVITYRDYF